MDTKHMADRDVTEQTGAGEMSRRRLMGLGTAAAAAAMGVVPSPVLGAKKKPGKARRRLSLPARSQKAQRMVANIREKHRIGLEAQALGDRSATRHGAGDSRLVGI